VPIFGFMPYVSKEHGWAICGGARLKVSSAYRIPGKNHEWLEPLSVLEGDQPEPLDELSGGLYILMAKTGSDRYQSPD